MLHLVGNLFLTLVELLRLFTHLTHLLGKLAGSILPELIPHLLQLALSTCGGRNRPRDHSPLELLGGLADSGPALAELFPCIGHTLSVLGPFHSLLQLVNIPKRFELLVPEPLKLTVNFFPLLLVLSLSKGRLGLLELVAHLALSPRQIAKAVLDLKILALCFLLLRLGQPFRLVSILSLSELQLLKLSFGTSRARGTARIGTAGLTYLVFAISQFEKLLISRLLRGQCRRKFRRR